MSKPWVPVRCEQDDKILFRQCGALAMFKLKGQGFICLTPVLAVCRCGWVWRSRDVAIVIDGRAIDEDDLKGLSA